MTQIGLAPETGWAAKQAVLYLLGDYMFTQDQKRERRRFDFGLALFYALVFLAGSVMFIAIAIFPPDDFPADISRWLIRIGSLIVGGACSILFVFFAMKIYLLLTSKRTITFKLRDLLRMFFLRYDDFAAYPDKLQKALLISTPSKPHRNVLLRQKPFHIADGIGAEMKNARGEDGVGLPLIFPKAFPWA